MGALQTVFSALFPVTALMGARACTHAGTPASTTAPGTHHGRAAHGGRTVTFRRVLQHLDLTADQQRQVNTVFAHAKTELQAGRIGMQCHRQALAATSPADPNYPALLATEKANAAARVQATSDTKTRIDAVLTPAQRGQIPALLAVERAARKIRIAAWREAHVIFTGAFLNLGDTR
jgi:Spy/CpxP family protein refolding chaperone